MARLVAQCVGIAEEIPGPRLQGRVRARCGRLEVVQRVHDAVKLRDELGAILGFLRKVYYKL